MGAIPFSRMLRNRQRGFTIVELLVTILIVSILASAVFPMAHLAVRRSKEEELRRSLRQVRQALDAYKQASDEGRIMKKPEESGYPHTLESLVEGVVDAKSPSGRKIYFLRRLPRDPFFADVSVPPSKSWGKRSYASGPEEPKEGADVYDIYSLSEGSGLNGIAYKEW